MVQTGFEDVTHICYDVKKLVFVLIQHMLNSLIRCHHLPTHRYLSVLIFGLYAHIHMPIWWIRATGLYVTAETCETKSTSRVAFFSDEQQKSPCSHCSACFPSSDCRFSNPRNNFKTDRWHCVVFQQSWCTTVSASM